MTRIAERFGRLSHVAALADRKEWPLISGVGSELVCSPLAPKANGAKKQAGG